jgi:hypothetical protein
MPISPFYEDDLSKMHRGAIYEFRPISWLEPPLWIARNRYRGQATIHKWEGLHNAFRQGMEENQEEILAKAKLRYVATVSSENRIAQERLSLILVAPFYTLQVEKLKAGNPYRLEGLRNNHFPNIHYLPPDRLLGDREMVIYFEQIRHIHRGFLKDRKCGVSLTSDFVDSMFFRYSKFLDAT